MVGIVGIGLDQFDQCGHGRGGARAKFVAYLCKGFQPDLGIRMLYVSDYLREFGIGFLGKAGLSKTKEDAHDQAMDGNPRFLAGWDHDISLSRGPLGPACLW